MSDRCPVHPLHREPCPVCAVNAGSQEMPAPGNVVRCEWCRDVYPEDSDHRAWCSARPEEPATGAEVMASSGKNFAENLPSNSAGGILPGHEVPEGMECHNEYPGCISPTMCRHCGECAAPPPLVREDEPPIKPAWICGIGFPCPECKSEDESGLHREGCALDPMPICSLCRAKLPEHQSGCPYDRRRILTKKTDAVRDAMAGLSGLDQLREASAKIEAKMKDRVARIARRTEQFRFCRAGAAPCSNTCPCWKFAQEVVEALDDEPVPEPEFADPRVVDLGISGIGVHPVGSAVVPVAMCECGTCQDAREAQRRMEEGTPIPVAPELERVHAAYLSIGVKLPPSCPSCGEPNYAGKCSACGYLDRWLCRQHGYYSGRICPKCKAPPPAASDPQELADAAAFAWYTRISEKATVYEKIQALADIIAAARAEGRAEGDAEIKRLNEWADGFSDAQLKERRLCEERIREITAERDAARAERESEISALRHDVERLLSNLQIAEEAIDALEARPTWDDAVRALQILKLPAATNAADWIAANKPGKETK